MRARTIALVGLSVAAAIAALPSPAGGSTTAHLKIPLPAPNKAKVSGVTVKVTAPKGKRVGKLKLVARNAAELGGRQLNSQVVAVVVPKSSRKQIATFKVFVFIHRFAAVAHAADRPRSAAVGPLADLTLGLVERIEAEVKIVKYVDAVSCPTLKAEGYYGDEFDGNLRNLVPSNDTAAEEQLDGAMLAKCPDSEPLDDGGD